MAFVGRKMVMNLPGLFVCLLFLPMSQSVFFLLLRSPRLVRLFTPSCPVAWSESSSPGRHSDRLPCMVSMSSPGGYCYEALPRASPEPLARRKTTTNWHVCGKNPWRGAARARTGRVPEVRKASHPGHTSAGGQLWSTAQRLGGATLQPLLRRRLHRSGDG